jgi:hypothetical protein
MPLNGTPSAFLVHEASGHCIAFRPGLLDRIEDLRALTDRADARAVAEGCISCHDMLLVAKMPKYYALILIRSTSENANFFRPFTIA